MCKKLSCFLLILCLFLPLAACQKGGDAESGGGQDRDYPVTISGVTLNAAPKKTIVLSACLADVVIACNYEVLLCGRSADCTQEALRILPDVGDSYAPDTAAMLALEPDAVLADGPLPEDVTSKLSGAGVPVVVIAPAASRADFERLYTDVCSVLNGGKTGYAQGVKVSSDLFMSVDNIGRLIPQTNTPPTACYVYNAEGDIATGDTLAGALIGAAGALNIAADNTDRIMAAEELSLASPTYIFCAQGCKDQLAANARFSGMSAVAEGRLIEMPPELMERQGKTILEAVSFLAEHMYPEMNANASAEQSSQAPESSVPPEVTSASDSSQTATSFAPKTYETLRPGDESGKVKTLQKRLIALGYLTGDADGKYGSGTENAVSAFQEKAGLTADGVAGNKTQQRLFADDAPKA